MKAFDLDKIIDFLSGRMSKKNQEDFEKEIAQQPDYEEDASTHQVMVDLIEHAGDQEKKEWLKEVLPKYQATKNKPKPRNAFLKWLIPVAAAAAIFMLFILPTLQQSSLTASQLATNNFQAYELTFGDRGTGGNTSLEAGQFYQTGNYSAAIPLLEQVVTSTEDGKYQLALGISYLETKDYSAAAQSFQSLITTSDPVYTEHAQWYLALTYLQQNNLTAAQNALQLLANNPAAFNHLKAKKMLQEAVFSEKK